MVYTVLRLALDIAVRDGHLARNPAAVVQRPGVKRKEARYLSADAVTALLRAAEGSRYHPVLVLIAATGLRRGEALGLHWRDVDLEAGTLRVTHTLGHAGGKLMLTEPKTDRARRTVPLPKSVVAILKRHRIVQLQERVRAANIWEDHDLVFTTEAGRPVDPGTVLRTVRAAARKIGVDGVGVHTLRHSAAAGWLEGGVHIKTAADLLGHSSVAITGDTYGHVSDDTARAAVDDLADTLGL